ncbi:hypothetical protein [Maricaulis sp.]|uniref:hypothetical protein n=1 Tax=Maricaulis sp. TaxID=1486257 RepID=UPI003A939A5B
MGVEFIPITGDPPIRGALGGGHPVNIARDSILSVSESSFVALRSRTGVSELARAQPLVEIVLISIEEQQESGSRVHEFWARDFNLHGGPMRAFARAYDVSEDGNSLLAAIDVVEADGDEREPVRHFMMSFELSTGTVTDVQEVDFAEILPCREVTACSIDGVFSAPDGWLVAVRGYHAVSNAVNEPIGFVFAQYAPHANNSFFGIHEHFRQGRRMSRRSRSVVKDDHLVALVASEMGVPMPNEQLIAYEVDTGRVLSGPDVGRSHGIHILDESDVVLVWSYDRGLVAYELSTLAEIGTVPVPWRVPADEIIVFAEFFGTSTFLIAARDGRYAIVRLSGA